MADGTHLRYVTYNLWGRTAWDRRRDDVVAGLRALDADVVGLQEVDEVTGPDGSVANQADDLGSALGMHVHFAPALSTVSAAGTRRFGNAVLSRFPLRREGSAPLPEGRQDEPRGVAHAVVVTPHGEQTVVVTHFVWRLDASADRVRQAVALADLVERLHPSPPDDDDPGWRALPPVVLADLNAEPASDEIRFLTGLHAVDGRGVRYADAWRYGGAGEGATYDPPSNPYAAASSEHGRRIDYVLVRGPVDAGLGVPRAPRLALVDPAASDHYAVVADLRADPIAEVP